MRRKTKIILFIICVCIAGTVPAQLNSYSYVRDIKPVDSTGYYKIRISNDILYKAKPNGICRVFELTEKDTTEIPYLSYTTYSSELVKCVRPIQVINKSYLKNKASYYTCVIDTIDTYSSLAFNIEDAEYDKELSLEGSDDNKHWKTITEKEKIFRFSQANDKGFTRNTIYFPEQNYKYLRITFNDQHSPKINLNDVLIQCYSKSEDIYKDELVPVSMVRTEHKQEKKTVLECTFTRHFFLTGIKFNIHHNAPFYKRPIHIFANGLNKRKQADWFLYQDDYLVSDSYNYTALSGMYDEALLNTNKLKIEIDNEDDQPLKDIQLQVYTNTKTLKLKLEKGKTYILAYGKEKDRLPVYDIRHFESNIPRYIKEAGLGPEKPISKPGVIIKNAKEPFFKSNTWIWVLMIASIVLIGGFAASLLRQSKQGQ